MAKLRKLTVFNLVSLTLLCLVLPVTAQTRRARFDPDGSFWIKGQPPTEFSDFSGINLNAKRLRHLPKAGVDENTGRHFPFKSLSVTQQRFVFSTVRVRGVSYSFIGTFLRGGNYQQGMLDDENPVLKGTLQKFVSGQKVAEAKLQFVYFGGT